MFFCKVSIQIKKCCRICSSPEKSGNIFNYISVMIMIYFSPLRCFSRSAQKASTTSANANRNIIAEPATFNSLFLKMFYFFLVFLFKESNQIKHKLASIFSQPFYCSEQFIHTFFFHDPSQIQKMNFFIIMTRKRVKIELSA